MDSERSQRLLENVFFFSLQDVDSRKSELFIDSPAEACYLHFLVPFEGTHRLPVKISVVPFCLSEFRGQTFYYAHGSYARCCPDADPQEFLPAVVEASQEMYALYIRHHRWDFNSSSSWDQLDLSPDTGFADESCLARSTLYLNQLLQSSVPAPRQRGKQGPARDMPSRANQRRQSTAAASATSSTPENPSSQDLVDRSITHIADDLLACFGSFDQTANDLRSYVLPLETSGVSEREPERCASHAWELCTTVARRAREQFKHAYFTRYISLCFFLIWETFSSKVGKACAREVNAKMKEAGFEGTSRTLKSLRDETIFINQLVASAESIYGSEPASRLLCCIFESSNYRFIRSINRFGGGKKLSVVKYICSKLHNVPDATRSSATLQTQQILSKYLPGLSPEKINMGIRYRPFDSSSPASNNPSPPTMSWEHASVEAGRRELEAPKHAAAQEPDHDPLADANLSLQATAFPTPSSSGFAMSDYEASWDSFADQLQIQNDESEPMMLESPLSMMPSELDTWLTSI